MKKLLSLLLIICSIGVGYADDKSTVTSLKYVTDELNTRQDKFGANDGKAMTFTNAAGGNLPRDVKASLGTGTSDPGLPTVDAVNTGLENKQDTIGAVNTNTVVTYTGTPGTLGQKGIYQDTGTYAAQSDNLIQASTFNAALRNGLNNEFVCAGTDDGTPNGNCWLWSIDNTTNETTTVHGKNLFNAVIERGNISSSTGQNTSGSNRCRTVNYIPVQPSTEYTLTANIDGYDGASSAGMFVYEYNDDASSWNGSGWKNPMRGYTFTTRSTTTKIRIVFGKTEGGPIAPSDISNVQLELGPTATPYEPYVGEETVNVYIPQNQTAQNQ